MDGSVKAFNRQSQVLKVVDSTVVDSGIYTFVRKRNGADSTVDARHVCDRLADRSATEGLGRHEGSSLPRDEEEGEVARSISTTAFVPPCSSRIPTLLKPLALVK